MSKVRTIEEIEMMAASEPFFGKGITVASGFDLGAKSPLDSRSIVHTIQERDAHVTGNRAYEGMLVYVVADKKTYQYTGTEWREFGFNAQDFQVNVIDSLESDDATKALSARQGKILKGLIDVIEGRVDGIDTALEGIYTKEQVDAIKQALEASVAEVSGRVDTVEEAVELLNGGAEEVGSVAHSVAQALVSAKAEANKLVEAAKTELSAKDAELSASIENVRTTLEAKDVELSGKITANTEAIAEVNVELAKKATVEALNAEISRAKAAEGVLEGRLDVLEGDEETEGSVAHSVAGGVATAAADATAKSAQALKDAKAYADQKVAEINGNISGLQSSIEAIEGDITDLQGADVALGERIDTMDAAYKAADVKVLGDAKAYTDAEVVKVNGTISALDAAYKAADKVLEGKIDTAKAEAIADAEGKIDAAKVEVKAYADQKVADLVDGAPEALDTLKELADALNQNEGAIEGLLEQIGTKADKATVEGELAKKADAATVNTELAKKATVEALEAEVSRAQGVEATLGGRIDGVIESVELVDGRVDKLCEKLDLQDEQLVRIDNIESDITELQGRADGFDSSIQELERDLAALGAKVEVVKEFVSVEGQTEFDLTVAPMEGSVKFFVNGIKYQAKFFSIEETKVVWSGSLFEMPADCDVEISFIEA